MSTKPIRIEQTDLVLCDFCGTDYTDSDEQGGLLFGSYATCPKCVPKVLRDSARYGERGRIRASCPEGKSFADWVREDLR